MKVKLLLVLALVCTAVGVGIVAVNGPANMTPDDELRFFFLLLIAAVLLSAAAIVAAIEGLGRKIAGAGRGEGGSPDQKPA
jgi:F0F1-type ATP synthase membrane subunit c/vacuolar-type H+-ATPase subunit K